MNSIVSAATIATATAIPAVHVAPAEKVDPAMASAIDQHRDAYIAYLKNVRVRANMIDVEWSPDFVGQAAIKKADRALSRTYKKFKAATASLLALKPSTLASTVALLVYVDDFNKGCVFLDEPGARASGYSSAPDQWPWDIANSQIAEDDDEARLPWILVHTLRQRLEAIVAEPRAVG